MPHLVQMLKQVQHDIFPPHLLEIKFSLCYLINVLN